MSCGYTDHDGTYSWVPGRLTNAHPDALRDLLQGARLALSERRPRQKTPRGRQ